MLIVSMAFVFLILLIMLGFPIYLAICIAGTGAMLMDGNSLTLVVTNIFGGIDSFPLMAIPLFVLAGAVMNECHITNRIVDLSDAMVGRLKGGMGHVNILSSMFFAGIQGSGVADASAIGSVMIPAMEKNGYDKDYSVAVTAASSAIGPVIPPSIAMIMFAYYTRLSAGKLFMGGMIPGILIGLGMMAVNVLVVHKRGYSRSETPFSISRVFRTMLGSTGALLMPVIIIVGIVTGIFTPIESGAAAVIYGLIYGAASGRLKPVRIPAVLIAAANTTAAVMIILAVSKILANVMFNAGFQEIVINSIVESIGNKYLATLAIMALLMLLGLFVDPSVLIVLFALTTFQIGSHLGFDPIHYGVVMVMTMLTGAITPPVGSMLFVACSIAKLPIEKSVRVLLPFLAVLIAVTILCLFVPQIVLWPANFVN